MRINRFVAAASGVSRRQADKLILNGRIKIGLQVADIGQEVYPHQMVTLDGNELLLPKESTTIILNKPVGYVVSRKGQGSATVYKLLPTEYQSLKPIGRLDKDSSGLLILSNDGQLIQSLSHPSYNKEKVYEVSLDKGLSAPDRQHIAKGIQLEDGLSKLTIQKGNGQHLIVSMTEGRNRQIRRTFQALGYSVIKLHRLSFDQYSLGSLKLGAYKKINIK